MALKNLFVFYVSLSVPIALLSLGAKFDYIHSGTFVALLFTYAFLYHPFICGLRLVQSGKINKGTFGRTLYHSGMTNAGLFFFSINKNKANENAG